MTASLLRYSGGNDISSCIRATTCGSRPGRLPRKAPAGICRGKPVYRQSRPVVDQPNPRPRQSRRLEAAGPGIPAHPAMDGFVAPDDEVGGLLSGASSRADLRGQALRHAHLSARKPSSTDAAAKAWPWRYGDPAAPGGGVMAGRPGHCRSLFGHGAKPSAQARHAAYVDAGPGCGACGAGVLSVVEGLLARQRTDVSVLRLRSPALFLDGRAAQVSRCAGRDARLCEAAIRSASGLDGRAPALGRDVGVSGMQRGYPGHVGGGVWLEK